MILEYQVRSVGHEQLRAAMRTVDGEAERLARKGQQRERRAQQGSQNTAAVAKAAADKELKAKEKAISQASRAEERARLKKERDEARARSRREREEKRAADRIRRYEERQYAGVLAHRNKMADRARRDQERQEKNALLSRQRTAIRLRQGAGRVFGGTARAIGGGIRTLGSVGVLGGTLALGNAVGVRSSESAMATDLANQASEKADPKLRDELLKESQGVRGFTGGEVLGSMSEFVAKTGELETARAIMQDLGELSLATGADLNDLGATAGAAFNVIRDQIDDPKEQLKELKELMATLAQQGAMGAVEIRDLARDFGKLGAATRSFEGGAPQLLRTMGAFAQMAVARGGAEGSADASTASVRLASDIVTNRKKFKGLGVDVKSEADPTKLRDPLEIMIDVLKKTKGDVVKTGGLFGQESAKIFKSLAAVYSEGEKKEKGSGAKAVRDEFARFATAEMSAEDIRGKADLRAGEADIQFKEAMKEFNAELGQRLLPELTKLIPKIAELTPHIAAAADALIRLAGWLAENPLEGFGAAILLFMTKELAAVGFSALFERAIMGMMGSGVPGVGGGGGVAPTVGGGGAGAASKAGRAGRLAKFGRGARAAGTVGLIAAAGMGLAYGASELYQSTDHYKEKAAAKVKADQEMYGPGNYTGQSIASQEFYRANALTGAGFSPETQALFAPPKGEGSSKQEPIDLERFQKVAETQERAAQLSLEAARLQQENASRMPQSDPARSVPLLFRGSGT